MLTKVPVKAINLAYLTQCIKRYTKESYHKIKDGQNQEHMMSRVSLILLEKEAKELIWVIDLKLLVQNLVSIKLSSVLL